MAKGKHTTALGEVLKFTASPEVAAFIDRVRIAAHDPKVSEPELISLIYGGHENPILDHTHFVDKGAVTAAVLKDPAYHVLCDLMQTKRESLPAPPPPAFLDISAVALQLDISRQSVSAAISRGDLNSEKVNGKHRVSRDSVESYRDSVKRRGRRAEPMLKIVFGNEPGKSCQAKVLSLDLQSKEGKVQTGVVRAFDRAALKFSYKIGKTEEKANRMIIIEPSTTMEEFSVGKFGVSGKFKIVERINNASEATKRWKAFQAS